MVKTNINMEINLNGPEGNIYFILKKAHKLLNENGQEELAAQMYHEVVNSSCYKKALEAIESYVKINYVNTERYKI